MSGNSRTADHRDRGGAVWGSLPAWAVVALGVIGAADVAHGQESELARPPVIERPNWSEELITVENEALDRLRRKDARRISLGEASLLHRRLFDTLHPVLPKNVTFRNGGPLTHLTGVPSGGIIRELPDEVTMTSSLYWDFEGTLSIFSFWISTARTNWTVAVCDMERRKLYLNVNGVTGGRSVDDKLDELGGRSVRETLQLLEQACARKMGEQPDDEGPGESAEQPAASVGDTGTEGKADFQELMDLIKHSQAGSSTP